MNWKRYRVLIVGGGVALLLSIAAIFWIVKSNGRWQENQRELDGLRSRQSGLVQGNPYPSQANFQLMQRNKGILDEKLLAFRTNILEGQLQPPPMARSNFGDHVRSMVPELRRMAAKATAGGEAGMVLRQSDFGLANYLGGQLPETEHVPRLMVQMEFIRHLTGLLAREGVSELVSLEREVFEAPRVEGRGGPALGTFSTLLGVPATPVPPARGQAARGQPARSSFDIAAHVEQLFDRENITLRFRAYEDRVWGVLNAMAADPNQILVKRIHLTNGNNRLWPTYLKPAAGMQEPRRAEVARPAAGLLALLGDPSQGDRVGTSTTLVGLEEKRQLMTGGELIDVVLEVTIFRLKPSVTAGGTP